MKVLLTEQELRNKISNDNRILVTGKYLPLEFFSIRKREHQAYTLDSPI